MNAKLLALIIVVVVVAWYVGYVWGVRVGKKEVSQTVQQVLTPTPGVDTGYQNPFEGVKLNPFK